MESVAKALVSEFEGLRSDRANFDSHWKEVAERILPDYKDEFQAGGLARTRGNQRTQHMFDSTAAIALGRFASIMDSLLTPRNSKWHKLRVSNTALQKDKKVKLWFDEVTDYFFKYRYAPKANFAS